jgi:hypothetical protein
MDVFVEGIKRPRNDEHIISPNYDFEPLRTAYNSKNPSILQGKDAMLSPTISPQALHSHMTACG